MRRKSIVLSLALFTAFSASADEKRFGRLADGKAFRVDDQGLQLVDQMAELQVTVDELNRQITSLEFELAEKDRALLSQGKGVVTTIRPGAAAEAAGAMPAAKGVDTCRAEIDSYQSKLSALENQLRASQALTQTRASCDYESQTRPLREQIATLQQTLKSNTSKVARGEEEQTRRELQISLAQYQDKLSEREAALEAATKKAETSGAKLTEFESQLAALKQQVDTQKSREQELLAKLEQTEEAAERTARETRAQVTSVPAVVAEPARARMAQPVASSQASPEVSAAKKAFNARLSKIQSLVLARKDLYDVRKGKKSGISISLQPLVAKNGVSLDTYRSRVSRLSTSDNQQAIQRGLDDIEAVLNDDISTMKRIGKL